MECVRASIAINKLHVGKTGAMKILNMLSGSLSTSVKVNRYFSAVCVQLQQQQQQRLKSILFCAARAMIKVKMSRAPPRECRSLSHSGGMKNCFAVDYYCYYIHRDV